MNPFRSLLTHLNTPEGCAEGRAHESRVGGVCPPARPLVSALLAQGTPGRPALCITPDWKGAERFAEQLAFFTSLFRFEEDPEPRIEILRFPPGLPEPPALAQASWSSVQERIRALIAALKPGFSGILVTSQEALREKVPPMHALQTCMRDLRAGQVMPRDALATLLQQCGYHRTPVVESHGEYAVRGSLIDFFPLSAEEPCRVDLFGDEIDAIRAFDPATQRSRERVDSVTVTPASLFLAGAVESQGLRERIKERSDALDAPARKRLELVERVETGLPAHEVPIHLPFFYPRLETLMDYLPEDALVLAVEPEEIRRTSRAHFEDCAQSLERLTAKGRILPSLEDLYLDPEQLGIRMAGTLLVSFPAFSRRGAQRGPPPQDGLEAMSAAQPQAATPGQQAGAEPARLPLAADEETLPGTSKDGDGHSVDTGEGRWANSLDHPAGEEVLLSRQEDAAEVQAATAGKEGPQKNPTESRTLPESAAAGEQEGSYQAAPLDFRFGFQSLTPDLLPGPEEKRTRGLAGYVRLIQGWIEQGMRVFLVCGSEPEKMRLGHLLREYEQPFIQPEHKVPMWGTNGGLYLLRGEIEQGFLFPDGRMVFLHEEDIFGKKVRKPRVREKSAAFGVDLRELKPGEHVVHVDFGIGLFQGLETLNIRGYVNDYLALLYENDDKLYLPVDRASRIQKYISTEDLPPKLDKLGGTAWVRTKSKVRESILAMAQDLVSLYAVRLVKKGHAYSKSDPSFEEFEAAFPYEETPDQMRAIEDVIQDMEQDRPMDRLVCGDVGYGKTEVAARAAYKAVMDGKQVAVLVPTTVLAQQHFGSFRNRFAGHPVEIEMLSRFRSGKEQRTILEQLAEGKVDIVIGTHRLLQKDVAFRELGLLILDEEHRFGVKHKETLKKIRTEVDVLTLSATPIPRTLQMSLLNLRDLSTISTPPQDRHAIETFVVPFDREIIRRAVEYEMGRGGQVFFVHNRVSDIESLAEELQATVPRARIAIGHGQMAEKDLERVMLEFVAGRYDVLVCTTIIESGLDIPNANTLLVNRADRFGLAQLYQLRGRVGRSERQAYAYLIVPDEDTLAGDARKRLDALYEFTELGSGFRIARYDLEIRGAGNLLGISQSGQIRAVGYDLYMEYLTRAIRELKGEEVAEEVDPEIHFEVPAYLPESYIEDSTQRLSFYKRLASALERDDVARILAELEDRYGPPPPEAQTLFSLIHIKVRLRRLKIREARVSDEGLLLSFASGTPVAVSRILQWAAREPDRLRLYPDDRLLVRFSAQDIQERLQNIERILSWLENRSDRQAAGGQRLD